MVHVSCVTETAVVPPHPQTPHAAVLKHSSSSLHSVTSLLGHNSGHVCGHGVTVTVTGTTLVIVVVATA